MSSEPAAAYLPTIEKLRRAPWFNFEVPSSEPEEVERLTMLVVQAALIRRTSWTEEVTSASPTLLRVEPPIPNDYEPRHHVRIDQMLGGGTCTACLERPGMRKCRVCGGRGRIMNDNYLCSCNSGWVQCPTCGGKAQTERVVLRYYSDNPAFLNEAYMPTHVSQNPAFFRLESFLETKLSLQQTPPEELRCHDLTGEVAGTAYRGGHKIVRPTFHGHDFGDTIDRARAGLSALGAGAKVVLYQVRAYAWPFMRVRWAGFPDWITYVDRGGSLSVFQPSNQLFE